MSFTPTPWLAHRHAQTLLAAFLRASRADLTTELVELPDGDAVEIMRTGDPAGRPAVLLLPGLEGSISSPYAALLLAAWRTRGWCGVILHHRGAARRPNRLVRGCHSGDWSDAAQVVAHLKRLGATTVSAVGVSLGGNVLLKWLGESGANCPLTNAVAVSVPFDLAACAGALDRGWFNLYRWHLLRDMRASTWAKRDLNAIPRAELAALRTFHAFDDRLTAPQNGFAGVADYYRCNSCRQFLGGITVPTVILHAADDPFVPLASVPTAAELPAVVHLELSARGGHVGFLTGWRPRSWLTNAVTTHLESHLP